MRGTGPLKGDLMGLAREIFLEITPGRKSLEKMGRPEVRTLFLLNYRYALDAARILLRDAQERCMGPRERLKNRDNFIKICESDGLPPERTEKS